MELARWFLYSRARALPFGVSFFHHGTPKHAFTISTIGNAANTNLTQARHFSFFEQQLHNERYLNYQWGAISNQTLRTNTRQARVSRTVRTPAVLALTCRLGSHRKPSLATASVPNPMMARYKPMNTGNYRGKQNPQAGGQHLESVVRQRSERENKERARDSSPLRLFCTPMREKLCHFELPASTAITVRAPLKVTGKNKNRVRMRKIPPTSW